MSALIPELGFFSKKNESWIERKLGKLSPSEITSPINVKCGKGLTSVNLVVATL